MDKKSRYIRIITGIVVFGSIWGLMECTIGDSLSNSNLPSGAIMTGFFGFGLMIVSRIIYQQRGMQLGIGLVAGALKFFHPLGSCMLCSAIAISIEGLLFEVIWLNPRVQPNRLSSSMAVSMGIISGFVLYSMGYIATQVITPLVSSAPISLAGLPSLILSALSTATLAGLASAATLTIVTTLPVGITNKLSQVRREIYYPTTSTISFLCLLGILLL